MNVRLSAVMPDTCEAKRRKIRKDIIAVDVMVDETMTFTINVDQSHAHVLRDPDYLATFIGKHVAEKIKAAFPGFMKVMRHKDGHDYLDSIYFRDDVRMSG